MSADPKNWYLYEAGTMDYRTAWDLQLQLVAARISGKLPVDAVLILEHPPVFTLGRRGGHDHLLVDEAFLASRGIPLLHVERGGDVTYHGPGQMVIYFIVNLSRRHWGVTDFVGRLEDLMIDIAGAWDIEAGPNPLNRGVWVAGRKLGSIGIAVRHGVTFHGLALNINTDLSPFEWVDPCGLKGIEMTSFKRELGIPVDMGAMRRKAVKQIEVLWNVSLKPTDLTVALKK